MIAGPSLAVNVAGYLVALTITLVSGYYTFRQRLTAYQLTRDFLVLVYSVIVVLMLVDFARIVWGGAALLQVYPLLSLGLGFLESILLLSAAVGAHLRPTGSSYALLFKDLRSRPRHLFMFVLFIAGTVAAEAYLWLYKPYSMVTAQDFAGGTVQGISYNITFSVGIGVLFAFFLAYPVALLVVSALRIPNPQMKRAQFGLAVGFAGSSAIYLISSVSLFNYGLDLTAIAYIILSIFFGMVARNFRRAAVFAGFVIPVATVPAPTPEAAGTVASGDVPIVLRDGELCLVEVDPAIGYEERLNDLVTDLRAEKRVIFLISAKGSRVYTFFSTVPGLKFYTMSESTRYIAPSQTNPDEVNIPTYDSAVLLEVIDRTLKSTTEPCAILFDSVSDMMVYLGFQPCYKFLREAGAIVSGKKAVALFTMYRGMHDDRSVTAMRSIFPSQLKLGAEGYEVVR